jgi:hypothetical protein
MKVDGKKALEEAKKEVEQEYFKEAKDKLKKKLTELKAARLVVKNLERELEDLEDEIAQGQ